MFKSIECVKKFCESSSGKCFILGVASAIVGMKVLKNKKTREVCVSGVAKTMKLYKDAQVAFQNIKEEAEDICYDAEEKGEAETAEENKEA